VVNVDILVVADGSPSGIGAVIDVLDAANKLRPDAFEPRFLGVGGDPVQLRGGLSLAVTDLTDETPAPWVIVPGIGATTPELMADRLTHPDIPIAADWLRHARNHGSTLVGACTAAFLLGRAGALDDRSCTCTWWLAGTLATLFPKTRVDADRMVVQDREVWTGGASFSQIDLALAVVEHHYGTLARAVANRLAFERRLSQADFVTAEGYGPEVAAIESYVLANIATPITLTDLADNAKVSARTLARRTTAATGKPPMQLVQHIRLQVALEKLRTTHDSTLRIAHAVGLADTASLYRLVKQATGRSPSQFRTGAAETTTT
jgi:transcriptional regulator GlxA family with amidase domain